MVRVAGYAFALLALTIVAAALFLEFYPDRAISYAAATISKSTGRRLRVAGDVDVRLFSWRPHLIIEGITFANPDWSTHEEMLEVGRFEFGLVLRRLLRGDLVISTLRLDDSVVRLEEREDGTNNWTLWAAEVARPDDRTEVPAVHRLRLRKSRILYAREGAPDSGTDLQLDLATGRIGKEVRIQAQGRYQKHPARIDVTAGSIAELQKEDAPFPIDVAIHAGPTSASIVGSLRGALDEGGLDVTMRITGDSLSQLYPLIGVVLPISPPYELTGRLERDGSVWRFAEFDGRLGDSDLSGDLSVDTAPARPVMTANLRSELLDFDDLAGLIGAPPATGAGETASSEQKAQAAALAAEGRVFPDEPVDVPRLHAMDIDARLVATRINAPNHLPIDRLDLHLTLEDGTLRAQPASFEVANGRVELYTTLHSDRQPLRADVELKARGLDPARILGETPFTEQTSGKLGGVVKLSMRGNSLREMAATADGHAQFAMADARVSHLLVEVLGLDIMQSLGVLIRGDESITIRCSAFDLTAEDGNVRSNLAVLDTDDTNLTADISLDLGTERLDVRVVPHPKDVSLLSLRQDLRVDGQLADLNYYPDPLKLGPVEGVMQKLNFLLAPIVGLLTPFDLNVHDDDNGCAAFLREQSAQAPIRQANPKLPTKDEEPRKTQAKPPGSNSSR